MRLRSLQRGLQEYITGGAAAIERQVRASHSMSPIERLDVYRGMYEARLIDALKVDYPALAEHLGERFGELASLFIRECPSRTYTLNRFGDGLPAFIPRVAGLPRPAYLRDLATYELAVSQIFDEVETSASATPADLTAESRPSPIPASRLLALWHPVHERIERRERTYLAVYRRDYTVTHVRLARQAFTLLSLLSGGASLGEAVEAAKGVSGRQIHEWFKTWTTEGLLAASPRQD